MKITFEETTTIPAAVAIKLTLEQVAARFHSLEPFGVDTNDFVGTEPLQFKKGETIEIIGDLPKGILPVYDRLRDFESGSENGELEFAEPPKKAHRTAKKSKANEQNPV